MESVHESSRLIIAAISASSNWMDEDLLPEILKRLPIKSLCRFRTVCKSWNSLISSASFINLHYSSTSSIVPANLKPYLRRRDFSDAYGDYALCHPQEEHFRRQLCFPFRFRYLSSSYITTFSFVDLIKGVICLSYSLNCDTVFMILWNPVIHNYLPLPLQPFPSNEILDLDFECTGHFYKHAIGFGYDSSKDDFKVVRIWIPNYPCDCDCKSLLPAYDVYSAGEGVWRVSIAEDIKCCQICSDKGCFLNGSVHWVVANHSCTKHSVLMFDCECEEFRTMELLEYGGMLSLLADWDGHVELWVMEEHGVATTWKRLYEILEDIELNWSIDVSQSSYQKLAPYGPNEWIKFRWNEELSDDILCNNVYEESMLLVNDTKSVSYTKAEIVLIDNSGPFSDLEFSD